MLTTSFILAIVGPQVFNYVPYPVVIMPIYIIVIILLAYNSIKQSKKSENNNEN